MATGSAVPSVYVLMPQIAKSDVNLCAEVEFPIYFKFFIKQAFRDPNKKVVVVGSAEQIAQVQTSFQESVFGPVPEHIYFERELCPKRRDNGYWVDFAKGFLLSAAQKPRQFFSMCGGRCPCFLHELTVLWLEGIV